jgi:hypothetical protein
VRDQPVPACRMAPDFQSYLRSHVGEVQRLDLVCSSMKTWAAPTEAPNVLSGIRFVICKVHFARRQDLPGDIA